MKLYKKFEIRNDFVFVVSNYMDGHSPGFPARPELTEKGCVITSCPLENYNGRLVWGDNKQKHFYLQNDEEIDLLIEALQQIKEKK